MKVLNVISCVIAKCYFRIVICLAFALFVMPSSGQSKLMSANTDKEVFSIVAAPGEDASSQMRISWAVDSLIAESHVQYKIKGDKNKKHLKTVSPQQKEMCNTFYGISSKGADGKNFTEEARFIKCGAEIKDLKSDTEYEYEIVSSNGKVYGPYYFKTAGAKSWSCCIISDFHSYPPLGKRLQSAMNMVKTVENYDNSINWILHVGDICAWGASYSFWERLYQEQPFRQYFWAGVNGNHDNMSRNYELTNQYFRNTSYYPENGYDGEKGVCYHFRYGDALFIMLNNENMHSDENLAKAQNWVKMVISEARAQKHAPKYVIVCEHYQWFFGQSGKFSQYSRWSKFFDEMGVDLAIAGNNHIYLRTGIIYDGKKTDGKKGTMYLQTSSSDNERGSSMGELTNNKDLVEYRYTSGGRTVSAIDMKVNKKGISLTLLDLAGHVIDSAFIPSK